MKKTDLLMIFAFLHILFSSTGEVFAIQCTEIPISNHQDTEGWGVDIWEDRIVYSRETSPLGPNIDIILHDLSTQEEQRLTSSIAIQWWPSIYEDWIVYWNQAEQSPYVEIYLYELATSAEELIGPGIYPDIWGDRIVWRDQRSASSRWRLMIHEILSGFHANLVQNLPNNWAPCWSGDGHCTPGPRIWQNRIVYENRAEHGGWDIFMYDFSTATDHNITNNDAEQRYPDIWGDRIVWSDRRNGHLDIYLYDLSTESEKRITADPGDQEHPFIWDNRIVWSDDRAGNLDIYMYDLSTDTEHPLVTHSADQFVTRIWKDRIVWIDFRNSSPYDNNTDIYMIDLSDCIQGADLSLIKTEAPDPVVVGQDLTYTIEVTNNGPDDATGVVITDTLAEEVQFVSASPGCTELAKAVTCQMGDLASGERATVTIVAKPLVEGKITNVAHVAANEDDPNPDNNDPSSEATACRVDLEIKAWDRPDPVHLGYYLVHTLEVINRGHHKATGIQVVDTLSGNVTLVSAASPDGDCSFSGGTQVICDIDELPSGEKAVITVVLRGVTKGTATAAAEVTCVETDCYSDNDVAVVSTQIREWPIVTVDRGSSPSLDVDSSGTPHITYFRNGAFRYATEKGNTWMIWTLGRNAHLGAPTSAVTVDSSDNVHICYAQNAEYLRHPRLKYRKISDGIWGPTQTVVTLPDQHTAFWPVSMDTDSQDKAHICYNESGPWMMDGRLKYLNNCSGAWSSPEDLGNAYDHVTIAVDSADKLHISGYVQGPTGGVFYLSNAPGGSWQPAELVQPLWACGQCEGMITSLAVDSANRPHITYAGSTDWLDWREDNRYAGKRPDDSWQLSVIATGGHASYGNAVAIDSLDKVHTCYYHVPSGEFRYATNASGSWEQVVFEDGDPQPLKWNAAIACDPSDRIHIAYDNEEVIKYANKITKADHDHDGISDEEENDAPNSGDGNNDGTPDSAQENVTSLQTHDDVAYVSLVSPDGTVMAGVKAEENPSPSDSPADQAFPAGFFEFTIYGIEAGGSTTVTLILPEEMRIETYYKYGPTPDNTSPHWYEFSYDSQTDTGALINGNKIVLHLVDGQRGDHDIAVNGIIVEPGTPARDQINTCDNDSDNDGDVDGYDLTAFSGPFDQIRVSKLASEFGRIECFQ